MRMMQHTRPLLVAACAAALLPLAAGAQGVTVTSATSIKAGGALGVVFRMAGANNTVTTNYVAGHKMRSDTKDNSNIIDVDAGRITDIDHKKKTYSTITFEELAAQLQAAGTEMKAQQAKRDEKASDVEWSYDVKAEKTGEHQTIAGYDATRNFITVTITAKDKSKAEGANEGSMVAFMDIWTSPNPPNAAAMAEFQKAYAAKLKTEFASPMKGLEAAFSSDPRMKTAMEATAKEMAKIQGAPLRSTTSFIIVPNGKAFDRQAALGVNAKVEQQAQAEEAKPKPKGGLFGKLKAAAAAAQQQEQGDDAKASPAGQSTMMSFTTEVTEIKRGVPADAFSVPAGYKEVKPEMKKR